MDSIRINTGEIKLMINDDPTRVIKFSPKDLRFAEAFYELINENEVKTEEFRARAKDIDDRGGDRGETLVLVREICDFMSSAIDKVFGAGTAITAFGGATEIDMFRQFLDGVMPYISRDRSKLVDKYTDAKEASVMQ